MSSWQMTHNPFSKDSTAKKQKPVNIVKVGNLLVHIRCVDEEDKALGMGIQVYGCSCPKSRNQEKLLRKRSTIRKIPIRKYHSGNVHLPVRRRARGVDLRQPGGRLLHPLVFRGKLLFVQYNVSPDWALWRCSNRQVTKNITKM